MKALRAYNTSARRESAQEQKKFESRVAAGKKMLDALSVGTRAKAVVDLGNFVADDPARGEARLAVNPESGAKLIAGKGGQLEIVANEATRLRVIPQTLVAFGLERRLGALDADIQTAKRNMGMVRLLENPKQIPGYATLSEFVEHGMKQDVPLYRDHKRSGMQVLDHQAGIGIATSEGNKRPTMENVSGIPKRDKRELTRMVKGMIEFYGHQVIWERDQKAKAAAAQ
jgi:hypothetical protein